MRFQIVLAVVCFTLLPPRALITFRLAAVNNAPADLVSLTISRDKDSKEVHLESVVLKNMEQKPISKYQIGWEETILGPDSLTFHGLGPIIALKEPLPPG